ncbi:MAG: phosphatidylserine decarboxylase family protein, partial [Thermodesulfobacteriota bacterium]
FRDPEREVPPGDDSIISPADGRVIKVEPASEDTLLKGEATKISIFMNVFNVHVNRVPASGRVTAVAYHPGKFFSADLDKASEDNERNAILIETPGGKRFVTVQIAGLIARRIVCCLKEGVDVEKGKRFGMIRFGSRLDVYLPPEARVEVRVGDRVKAGSSILGYW